MRGGLKKKKMKYKVTNESPSWPKVLAVFQKIRTCNDAATALVEEITPGEYNCVKSTNPFTVTGKLIGFCLKECPKGWYELIDQPGAFYPKRLKANLDLRNRIENLPEVTSRELGSAIGYGEYFSEYQKGGGRKMSFQPNGWIKTDDAFYFNVPEFAEDQYKPLEGIVEVLTSEWNEAMESKKNQLAQP